MYLCLSPGVDRRDSVSFARHWCFRTLVLATRVDTWFWSCVNAISSGGSACTDATGTLLFHCGGGQLCQNPRIGPTALGLCIRKAIRRLRLQISDRLRECCRPRKSKMTSSGDIQPLAKKSGNAQDDKGFAYRICLFYNLHYMTKNTHLALKPSTSPIES